MARGVLTAMSTAEQQFAWMHAAKWAHGPWRTTASAADELSADSRACAYADWYVGTYGGGSTGDLPAHSRVWPEFVAHESERKAEGQ